MYSLIVRRKLHLLMASLVVLTSLNLCFSDEAPKSFIKKNKAPTDCDPYKQKWTVIKEGDLFESPTNYRVVARLTSQETVTAMTGEVHVIPVLATVTVNHAIAGWDHSGNRHNLQLHTGDQFYLLGTSEDQLGLWKILIKGNRYEAEIDLSNLRKCKSPSESCWASLNPAGGNEEWWVQFKNKDGILGWARVLTGDFTIPDTCG